MRKLPYRLIIAIMMLIFSLAAIAWSFLPGARIVRREKIIPSDMQLPTPSSYKPSNNPLVQFKHHMETELIANCSIRPVLLIYSIQEKQVGYDLHCHRNTWFRYLLE